VERLFVARIDDDPALWFGVLAGVIEAAFDLGA
jgi:hypothetical protein